MAVRKARQACGRRHNVCRLQPQLRFTPLRRRSAAEASDDADWRSRFHLEDIARFFTKSCRSRWRAWSGPCSSTTSVHSAAFRRRAGARRRRTPSCRRCGTTTNSSSAISSATQGPAPRRREGARDGTEFCGAPTREPPSQYTVRPSILPNSASTTCVSVERSAPPPGRGGLSSARCSAGTRQA